MVTVTFIEKETTGLDSGGTKAVVRLKPLNFFDLAGHSRWLMSFSLLSVLHVDLKEVNCSGRVPHWGVVVPWEGRIAQQSVELLLECTAIIKGPLSLWS